ncbi:MAG TPA: aldo/keto reductase, partial [Myxococcota bacterium]
MSPPGSGHAHRRDRVRLRGPDSPGQDPVLGRLGVERGADRRRLPLRRGIEREVLPTCEREGLGQIVFSPLAQGVLTGKYVDGQRPAGSRAL